MGFEWDVAKSEANYVKHAVDFTQAKNIFAYPTVERPDPRNQTYGEERFLAIGHNGKGQFFLVVYTWRGPNRRIISIRKAGRHEQKIYQNHQV